MRRITYVNQEMFQSECVSDYGRQNMWTSYTAISQTELLDRSFAFNSLEASDDELRRSG